MPSTFTAGFSLNPQNQLFITPYGARITDPFENLLKDLDSLPSGEGTDGVHKCREIEIKTGLNLVYFKIFLGTESLLFWRLTPIISNTFVCIHT